jgi:hypothetical protein
MKKGPANGHADRLTAHLFTRFFRKRCAIPGRDGTILTREALMWHKVSKSGQDGAAMIRACQRPVLEIDLYLDRTVRFNPVRVTEHGIFVSRQQYEDQVAESERARLKRGVSGSFSGKLLSACGTAQLPIAGDFHAPCETQENIQIHQLTCFKPTTEIPTLYRIEEQVALEPDQPIPAQIEGRNTDEISSAFVLSLDSHSLSVGSKKRFALDETVSLCASIDLPDTGLVALSIECEIDSAQRDAQFGYVYSLLVGDPNAPSAPAAVLDFARIRQHIARSLERPPASD